MSNKIVPGVYRTIIDDVVGSVRSDFDEYGVEEDVLAILQQRWESRLLASRVADFEPPPPPPPPPAPVPSSAPAPQQQQQQQQQRQQQQQQQQSQTHQSSHNHPPAPLPVFPAGYSPAAAAAAAYSQLSFPPVVPAANAVAPPRPANLLPTLTLPNLPHPSLALPNLNLTLPNLPGYSPASGVRPLSVPGHAGPPGGSTASGSSSNAPPPLTHQQQLAAAVAQIQQQYQGGLKGGLDDRMRLRGGAGDSDDDSSSDDPDSSPETRTTALPYTAASTSTSFSAVTPVVGPPGVPNENGIRPGDEQINSDLDDSDDEQDEEVGEGGIDENTDLVFCTYDKVQRVKNKWKMVFKDGVASVNGRDYLFSKCTSEFEW